VRKNNLFKEGKFRTIFSKRMPFYLVPGGFLHLINWNYSNSNWKKLLGFRNMQEKLENDIFSFPRVHSKTFCIKHLKDCNE
jgi:hypothetical protein